MQTIIDWVLPLKVVSQGFASLKEKHLFVWHAFLFRCSLFCLYEIFISLERYILRISLYLPIISLKLSILV